MYALLEDYEGSYQTEDVLGSPEDHSLLLIHTLSTQTQYFSPRGDEQGNQQVD